MPAVRGRRLPAGQAARRDDAVGGLAPELGGALGGRVGHGAVLSVVDECILKDWASSMRVRKDDTGHTTPANAPRA